MAQIAWEDVTYTIPKARSSADMTNKQHYITKYHTTENQHALGAAAADVLSGIAQFLLYKDLMFRLLRLRPYCNREVNRYHLQLYLPRR